MTQFVSPVMRRYSGYPEQWIYPATDEWSVGGGQIATGTDTVTLVANTAVVFPAFIDRPLRFLDVALVVTAADSDKEALIGLYEFDPVTGKIGNLVFSTEALDVGSATGLVKADLTTITPEEGDPYTSEHLAEDLFRAGWYAWVIVSDGTPTVRVATVPDPYGGLLKPSTTTLTAITHYTAAMTTPLASGLPEDASDASLTPVTSASDFSKNQGVLTLAKPLTV